MKFFNTAGPVVAKDHYHVPITARINKEEIFSLIDQKKYFVLHAPRQSGKTSSLLTLMDLLNKSGKYKCLYINVESAQAARENVEIAMESILSELENRETIYLNENKMSKHVKNILKSSHTALANILTKWTQENDLPTVLLIDEIDSLVGDSLISVLRQLRSRYDTRPNAFPQSIILCGVRDVRDYRIHSSEHNEIITGGSCFNVKAKSIRLGNFRENDVKFLYLQHTESTGQEFSEDAIKLAYNLTKGQPWLVNALAYEACFEMPEGKDRNNPITVDLINQAKDKLILSRVTHLDQLVDKLKEERVKNIIEPILEGLAIKEIPQDDLQYLIDLGLVSNINGKIEISNPIYKEVIPRELNYISQMSLGSLYEPEWYVNEDGSLNVSKLIENFQEFFRENSETWIERFAYKEAGPQLLLQAFLQRVVNGGGRIYREYGLGKMRTDILIEWKDSSKYVLELKILHKSLEKTIALGLEQTAEYMDRTGTNTGHLLIFDKSEDKGWEEKIFRKEKEYNDKKIVIWGM
ncbi:ATP-binding protein [Natronospora cellulosivora (SeqCode)]